MGTEVQRWVCELQQSDTGQDTHDRDLLSHGARSWKSEIRVSAGLVLSEGSLLGA